jgi:hypothetical protein
MDHAESIDNCLLTSVCFILVSIYGASKVILDHIYIQFIEEEMMMLLVQMKKMMSAVETEGG